MSRQATVVVADDALYSLSGKLNLSGVYGTDISIPFDPTHAAQLIFCFIIEAEPDDPYQQIVVRVELPGGDSRQMQLAMHTFVSGEADKIRWCVKYPLLFQAPALKPGPILASVLHEKGIIITAAPFIVLRQGVKILPSAAPAGKSGS